jgi:hypothetical protein
VQFAEIILDFITEKKGYELAMLENLGQISRLVSLARNDTEPAVSFVQFVTVALNDLSRFFLSDGFGLRFGLAGHGGGAWMEFKGKRSYLSRRG